MSLSRVDRTRYLTGLQTCLMKRYLGYHAGPNRKGWSRKGRSVALSTGIYTHEILALILAACKAHAKVISDDLIQNYIDQVIKQYHADLEANGFDGMPEDEAKLLVMEQSWLIQAMVWAWVRTQLTRLIQEYEIVDVEREEELVLHCTCKNIGKPSTVHDEASCTGILLMSRPDFLARNRETGVLSNHDFKTTGSISSPFIDSFQESFQMAIGCLAAEQRLGEPVREFYIHAIEKGGRGEFSTNSGRMQQYSHLCYAQLGADIHGNWVPEKYTGYWVNKQGAWESSLTPKEWVDALPERILGKTTSFIGPYERQDIIIQQFVRALPTHESWWGKTLGKLRFLEARHGWTSDEFQKALDIEIPRSYNCSKQYGSKCPVYEICFKGKGWEDPVASGIFEDRIPHHEAEK